MGSLRVHRILREFAGAARIGGRSDCKASAACRMATAVRSLREGERSLNATNEGPVKAAVLEDFEKPLAIRTYPDPGDPAPGEALIRVEVAGICGTDVHLWLGQLAI